MMNEKTCNTKSKKRKNFDRKKNQHESDDEIVTQVEELNDEQRVSGDGKTYSAESKTGKNVDRKKNKHESHDWIDIEMEELSDNEHDFDDEQIQSCLLFLFFT